MSQLNRCIPCLGILCLLLLSPAFADDAKEHAGHEHASHDAAAMQEAWMKAMSPGEPHQHMAKLAGDWTYEMTFWEAPGAPPSKSTGKAKREMVLGGRYLHEETSGSFAGQDFQGYGVTGYDNIGQQYVSTWIDNMGTGIFMSHGQMDENGNLVMHGEMEYPGMGPMKVRTVTRMIDDDHHAFEFYAAPPGQPEMKQMVIEYARK